MATHPVDFRKSVHTLSALVSEALRANPYSGDVFVFRSKRMDRVKLLAWDGSVPTRESCTAAITSFIQSPGRRAAGMILVS